MTNNNKRTYPFLILCMGLNGLAAQNDPCVQQVRSMYKNILAFDAMQPKEDRTYYMNYTVRTVPKDSALEGIATSEIEVLASGKNLEIKSEHMEVYQDGRDAFLVLPQKKMVIRNEPYKPKGVSERKANRFRIIQDTLFMLSKVSVCKVVQNGYKMIVLDVNEKGKQLLSVKRLSFIIDEKRKEFKNVKIEYTDSEAGLAGKIAYVEYAFKQVTTDYKARMPVKNASQVIMKNNKLSAKYSGYTLVDNKKKETVRISKQ